MQPPKDKDVKSKEVKAAAPKEAKPTTPKEVKPVPVENKKDSKPSTPKENNKPFPAKAAASPVREVGVLYVWIHRCLRRLLTIVIAY